VLVATLQRVLNRYVSESPAARDRLRSLGSSSFALEIAGTGLACTLAPADGGLAITPGAAATAAARLRVAPLDLLRLARGAADAAALRRAHAEIAGDPQVAESYAKLLALARPDLEEVLAGFVGDLLAYEIGCVAAGGVRRVAHAARSLETNTAEYLQEETGVLPAPLEAQAFYDDVEQLRDAVERASARLALLEQRAAAACAVSRSR
jgi:ubiquinone biosynthesis protein UbiJ